MRLTCTVNGTPRTVEGVPPGESLLLALRERMGLPGSKNACEEGECGSCTVYLDDVPVCACLVAAGQADGRAVRTVEGLAAGADLHPVQQAFLDAGAVQCGFCTPGLVVAVHDLLAPLRGPPSDAGDPGGAGRQPVPVHRLPDDPRRGPPGRRGGGELVTATRPAVGTRLPGAVGDSPLRPDGVPKVTGEFAYSSDLWVEGMLWGATARSPHPRARIRGLDLSAARAVRGVRAVLTAADVPGEPLYGLEHADQPVLAADEVRYHGEPVAVVAADDPDTARRAAALVAVDWEELPAVTDMRRALDPDAERVHPGGNLVRQVLVRRGDAAAPRRPGRHRGDRRVRGRHAGPGLPRPGVRAGRAGRGRRGRAARGHPVAARRPAADRGLPGAAGGQGAARWWPGSAAPSAAARTCPCRCTRACWRCAPAGR